MTTDWPFADQTELARKAECFETPVWAIEAIMEAEVFTPLVIDPCCGDGRMGKSVVARGGHVISIDKYDWGHGHRADWLDATEAEVPWTNFTVFMNPPFSLAERFVMKAFDLGARKVVCFQRFAWWESKKRREFWELYPPNRIYICGERADCWRIDIPPDKRTSSTPTAHAWFVWERGNPPGTVLGHIFKEPRG